MLNDIECKVKLIDSNPKPKTDEASEDGDADDTEDGEGSDNADGDVSEDVEEDEEYAVSEEDVREIAELIKKKYDHIADTEQRAKFTTTELAHKKSAKPISLTKPSFASGGAVSGVEKGNAYHHCMEHFPIDRINADMSFEDMVKAVKTAIDDMTEDRKLTENERDIIEAERVAKFFMSGLGKRMLRIYAKEPEKVIREQSFYAEANIDELRGEYKGDELRQEYKGSISIQGQIDMYIIEDGEIVVVDYKSDTVENLDKERKNYEFQVEIYTKILKKLTGMNVKEMYLYAFLADEEMKI